MTEVPEHLRKRAEEARAKAAAAKAAADAPAEAPAEELSAEQQEAASKIPAHLLERSKAAKAKAAGGDAGGAATGTAVATAPTAAALLLRRVPGADRARWAHPAPAHRREVGPIQDVKAVPQDKVHTWPHLLVVEFGAALLRCIHLDLLDLRERSAAGARQLQRDAEPVEGPVVLPRPAGTPHGVPPDGRRRDHPGHRPVLLDVHSLHRPKPVGEARGSQVRGFVDDRPPHVLGRADHDRLVLPRSRIQLRLPWEAGLFFEL